MDPFVNQYTDGTCAMQSPLCFRTFNTVHFPQSGEKQADYASDWERLVSLVSNLNENMDAEAGDLSHLLEKLLWCEEAKGGRKRFTEEMASLSAEALDRLLLEVWKTGVGKGKGGAPDWLVCCLSPEKMREIVKAKYEGLEDVAEYLSDCKSRLAESVDTMQDETWEIAKIWKAFVRFLTNIIDIFLIAFTLFDVGKDPQSAWEAQAMLDIYYKFFMIPAMIALLIKLFLPAAGLEVYAITAAVVVVLMVLMTIYIRFLRPCPDTLPHCESNLTLEALEGRIGSVVGREREIEEMIQMLDNPEGRQKNHVLLVGKSGVGKTEVVRGLARKIAKGEVPDSLKGRKVFLVNTASLVSGGFFGYADQMKVLLNRIRRLDQVILFFDEVHVALKNKSSLSDFLKPVLDRADLRCVAATTDREFKAHIEGIPAEADDAQDAEKRDGDPAFLRRFNILEVTSLRQDALLEILLKRQQTASPHVYADREVLEYLLAKISDDDQLKKKAQPAFALAALDLCISSVAKVFEEGWHTRQVEDIERANESRKRRATEDIASLKPAKKGSEAPSLHGERERRGEKELKGMLREYKKIAGSRRSLFLSLHEKISALDNLSHRQKEEESLKIFLDLEYVLPSLDNAMGLLEQSVERKSADEGGLIAVRVTKGVVDSVIERMKNMTVDTL